MSYNGDFVVTNQSLCFISGNFGLKIKVKVNLVDVASCFLIEKVMIFGMKSREKTKLKFTFGDRQTAEECQELINKLLTALLNNTSAPPNSTENRRMENSDSIGDRASLRLDPLTTSGVGNVLENLDSFDSIFDILSQADWDLLLKGSVHF
jgi:hypothetical protein